jgi:hypothetical protein
MEPMTGGCACRAVRYEIRAEPIRMLKCHCRDCQRASGSAYAALMVMPKEAFRVEGELRYFERVGGSGMPISRGFCPQCGSPVTVMLATVPEVVVIQAASLDDPSRFAPTYELFTSCAQPWDLPLPVTEKFPRSRSG